MANNLDYLLLHAKTRLQIEYFLKNPPQSLLISASSGSGKKTIAKTIAAELLQLKDLNNLISYPYFLHVMRLKNKSDISIEQVRTVIDALKLKTPGSNLIRRAVLIENAQLLSIPAQNALLKILEEPNADTIFILTVTSVHNVLPTIASRMQKLEVLPIGLNDAHRFWEDREFQKQSIESAWRLSGGSVGLVYALLAEDKNHPLKIAVDDAKAFIKASKYERLLQADRLSRSKENFILFLEAMSRTLNFLNHAAVKSGKDSQANNILHSRKVLKKSTDALEANANARLVALSLALNMKI
jgi:DNA polymerase III delta prime subunit